MFKNLQEKVNVIMNIFGLGLLHLMPNGILSWPGSEINIGIGPGIPDSTKWRRVLKTVSVLYNEIVRGSILLNGLALGTGASWVGLDNPWQCLAGDWANWQRLKKYTILAMTLVNKIILLYHYQKSSNLSRGFGVASRRCDFSDWHQFNIWRQ